MIWAELLHLSTNIGSDVELQNRANAEGRPDILFDHGLWRELLEQTARAGVNMIVIDVNDGVRYESHPEIAASNALSREQLRAELEFMRGLGLEPIPKLNFSTAHDAWLGEYHRMVSTRKYYDVCRDLIREVAELFDTPRFFHIGMDEETAAHQKSFDFAVMRQHELWWHDLLFYVAEVEKAGARAWMWSDNLWHHPDTFFKRMPKTVLQSNWYYGERFDWPAMEFEAMQTRFDDAFKSPDWERDGFCQDDVERRYSHAYLELEAHGYDQIPTGSNWQNMTCTFDTNKNFEHTVEFCREAFAPERLKGFLMTAWQPTLPEFRAQHEAAIAQVAREVGR
jgi:hypothetical protein